MPFGNEFDIDKPVGSDLANTLYTIIEAKVKKALAERYALEHIALNSGSATATDPGSAVAQGRHKAGAVGVLLTGTTAEINTFANNLIAAGTPPGTGSLALADGTTLMYFNGTAFVNMGLTAAIYTAGDGLTLASGEFSADFSDDDTASTGTSAVKVINPATLKWAYGNTEYLEAKQIQASGVAEVMEASPYERHWNQIITNTIQDSSIIGDYQITLPAGIYEIRVHQPILIPNGTGTQKFWLYNETAAAIQTDVDGNDIVSTNAGFSSNNIHSDTSYLVGTFSLDVESVLTVRAAQAFGGVTASVVGLVETYGTLQIWKKKLN